MRRNIKEMVKYTSVATLASIATYQFCKHNLPDHPTSPSDRPILTTAGIVHVCPNNKIALIERGKAPKGIAMFGGHVEAKESPEEAFTRELKEELNISILNNLSLIGVHGKYGRDPRQHSVEITYSCTTSEIPYAGSDAKEVVLYTPDEIRNKIKNTPEAFAFDHAKILKGYIDKLENCNPCNQECNIR